MMLNGVYMPLLIIIIIIIIILIIIIIIIINIYMAPGMCCNCCCSKYEMNFAQRHPKRCALAMRYLKFQIEDFYKSYGANCLGKNNITITKYLKKFKNIIWKNTTFPGTILR